MIDGSVKTSRVETRSTAGESHGPFESDPRRVEGSAEDCLEKQNKLENSSIGSNGRHKCDVVEISIRKNRLRRKCARTLCMQNCAAEDGAFKSITLNTYEAIALPDTIYAPAPTLYVSLYAY